MMGAVRSWLLALIAVALVCALADALMPPGGVKRVGRLVCGLVLMAAVLSPLSGLDVEAGQRWLEEYFLSLSRQETELGDLANRQTKVIIEQQCAAYIVDKAAQLGLTCTARVECRASGEGLYLPARAEISGGLDGSGRAQLSRMIEEDLGIPAAEQVYMEKEDVP